MIKYLLKPFGVLLLMLSLLNQKQVYAQYHTTSQSIVNQEFYNPAYNSFKANASVSLFNRWQWTKVANSPKTYALNAYSPIKKSALGIGTTLITESIGLRNITTMHASLSHNIKVGETSFLALGYSLGFESICYDKDEMITNLGVDISSLGSLNSFSPALNMGLMYLSSNFFAGISTNMVLRQTEVSSTMLPGFDFTTGMVFDFENDILFKPALVVKYYKEQRIGNDPNYDEEKFARPLIDLSANFKIGDLFWLGTSHRFNQAQTFLLEMTILEKLKMGITYELGFGDGLNQYNSQSIRLAWNFSKKKNPHVGYSRRRIPSYSPIIYYP
nr:PorP/SprF family type IX secretion system membrane protein [uncultured Marinifilum sp.]